MPSARGVKSHTREKHDEDANAEDACLSMKFECIAFARYALFSEFSYEIHQSLQNAIPFNGALCTSLIVCGLSLDLRDRIKSC